MKLERSNFFIASQTRGIAVISSMLLSRISHLNNNTSASFNTHADNRTWTYTPSYGGYWLFSKQFPYRLGLYLRISIAHFKWRHIVWNLRFLTELHRQVCLHIDFHWISLRSVRLFSLLLTRQLLKVTTILIYRLSRQAIYLVEFHIGFYVLSDLDGFRCCVTDICWNHNVYIDKPASCDS